MKMLEQTHISYDISKLKPVISEQSFDLHYNSIYKQHVDRFNKGQFVDVFMAQNKIKMMWNGKVYVGNKMGMEFTTPGPKEYQINKGRGY